jgi:hypothetical protein
MHGEHGRGAGGAASEGGGFATAVVPMLRAGAHTRNRRGRWGEVSTADKCARFERWCGGGVQFLEVVVGCVASTEGCRRGEQDCVRKWSYVACLRSQ